MINPNLKSQRGNPSHTSNREELKAFAMQNSIAVEYLLCFIDDINNFLPHSLYGAADSTLDKKTIRTRFQSEGLSFATLALPKLSAGLFLYFETGQVCYPSFVIQRGTVHPAFLRRLFRLACSENEYQVTAIRLIYQIGVLFKKLKGPYPDSVLSKQLTDFVRVDNELESLEYFDSDLYPILERARDMIRELFSGFSMSSVNVKPRPGPGATNDPVAKHLRFRPHVLYTQVDNVIPYVDFFVVNAWDIVHQTKLYRSLYLKAVKEQRARFKFVHKQVGKARGICIEQNEVQYLQQAIKRALYDWIQKHPLTKGKINFDDQSINAKLALLHSVLLIFATIDMSEASDRIARMLVSWLFQDTELHDVLMALSTKWIDLPFEVNGEKTMRTAKFAPMGSGICFPIMSVVHWALVRSIIVETQCDPLHIENVYVYGDDIILPSEVVEKVYKFLPRFGMKINETKSYYRSSFRESCGVHAYNGCDITPIFIKNLPVSTHLKPAMSCLAVEEQLENGCYFSMASLMREHVRKAFTGYEIPYVPTLSAVFGFKRKHLEVPSVMKRMKENDSWGNPVFKVRCVVEVQESHTPPTEEECYLRHVLTKDMDREVKGNPDKFKLVWKVKASPELHAKKRSAFLDYFEKRYTKTDPRSVRDKLLEKEYEFPRLTVYRDYFRIPFAARYTRQFFEWGYASGSSTCQCRLSHYPIRRVPLGTCTGSLHFHRLR